MGYTLDQLAGDIRETLKSRPMPAGGEAVCAHVERALTDETFRTENFGSDKTEKRTIVHEDPELGFCICVHIYEGAADSGPHDHGSSWAIYGQADGETEMTDWRIVTPVSGEKPAQVAAERVYTLTPGMAHFYPVGAVHSPTRKDSTKLLRIEGANLDTIKRTPIVRAESENA